MSSAVPCRDCTDRASGCHDTCFFYWDWLRELKETKSAANSGRAVTAYFVDLHYKLVKASGKKRKRW